MSDDKDRRTRQNAASEAKAIAQRLASFLADGDYAKLLTGSEKRALTHARGTLREIDARLR